MYKRFGNGFLCYLQEVCEKQLANAGCFKYTMQGIRIYGVKGKIKSQEKENAHG